jgi:hypothetical protein
MKRGKMGYGLECRHRHQGADSPKEHQVSFKVGDVPPAGIDISRGHNLLSPEQIAGDQKWDDYVDQRGEEEPFHNGQSGDLPTNPEHGGGEVVQNGAEKKGDEADHPHQGGKLGGVDA